MNKNVRMGLLGVLGLALLSFLALNYLGLLDGLMGTTDADKVQTDLMIDFVSVQTTIRAVQSPEIPNKQFIETVDTLTEKVDVTKLRNPFKREIRRVELKPKPKPKEVKPPPQAAAPKPKPKKRIVRPRITVNGIIWDRSNPYAILDGEIYGEGDYIKGYTIQTIVDTLIVLYNDDDVFTLNYNIE